MQPKQDDATLLMVRNPRRGLLVFGALVCLAWAGLFVGSIGCQSAPKEPAGSEQGTGEPVQGQERNAEARPEGRLEGPTREDSPDASTMPDASPDVAAPEGAQENTPDTPDNPDAPDAPNACKPTPKAPTNCQDLLEGELPKGWSTQADDNAASSLKVATGIFGQQALRVETQAAFAFRVRFAPSSPVDATNKNFLHFVVRAENTNQYGWQGGAPIVRLEDDQGNKLSLTPAQAQLPTDGLRWKRILVPLKGGNGWTLNTEGTGTFDASKVRAIELQMDTWGKGFWLVLDGLALLEKDTLCAIRCPQDCSKRGTCDPAQLGCACQLGATGDGCETCLSGFVLKDGRCVVEKDGNYDSWPNAVSKTNGDAWLLQHHQSIKLLQPKVLVVHFVNVSTPAQTKQLIEKIFAGFREGSRAYGYRDTKAKTQLDYQIAKIVDLRDGFNGNPAKPSDWPFRNSTFYPRKKSGDKWVLDYGMFFSEKFAKLYGYKDPKDPSRYLSLCELIEQGILHEVWMVGAHTDGDAAAAEVLEHKQRYTATRNPIPGSLDRCGGNGCFDKDVPQCKRSVKIGFVNYERGPGCYMHSIGHGIEWFATRDIIPSLQRWFAPFAGFDLDKRYQLPFPSLYGVGCPKPPCISYQRDGSATITHNGKPYNIPAFDGRCGNVHFPPNGIQHYDYTNTSPALASCSAFGHLPAEARAKGRCDDYPQAFYLRSNWQRYEALSPDCGGGFLVWWYQNMPSYGSKHTFPDGSEMLSIWPFLYY